MKKDSEHSAYLKKKSIPVVNVDVPTESDLHRAPYYESANLKESKVESKSSSSTPSLATPGSNEEGLCKVEAKSVASSPVSHTRHLYRVCKKSASHVAHNVLDGGRFVYRGGKVEINVPFAPKWYNPSENKSVEAQQQIVTAVPSPLPSHSLFKDLVTPTTFVSILLIIAIARQPVEVVREIAHQLSALYCTLKQAAPPAHLRKLRQLIDADRFVNNRATFTVSSKENKRRRAEILLYKTKISAPPQQLERGSIYIASKRIPNTSILQCMYGKVVKTTKLSNCELAFDLSLPPCFKFKPSASLSYWCYMSSDAAKRLNCDFTGLDELMRRGEL